jgi:hypothetical protein
MGSSAETIYMVVLSPEYCIAVTHFNWLTRLYQLRGATPAGSNRGSNIVYYTMRSTLLVKSIDKKQYEDCNDSALTCRVEVMLSVEI